MKKQEIVDSLAEPSIGLEIANSYFWWIAAFVIAILILICYMWILSDKISTVRDIAEENLPAKEKVLSDIQIMKKNIDKKVQEFDTISQAAEMTISRLNELLPAKPDYEQFFGVLDDVTRKSGLAMTNISIALSEVPVTKQQATPQVVGGKATTNSTKDSVTSTTISSVRMVTISLNIEGGNYETFKHYLDTLERNLRLLDVKSVIFEGSSFSMLANGKEAVPRYSLELVTYYNDAKK